MKKEYRTATENKGFFDRKVSYKYFSNYRDILAIQKLIEMYPVKSSVLILGNLQLNSILLGKYEDIIIPV